MGDCGAARSFAGWLFVSSRFIDFNRMTPVFCSDLRWREITVGPAAGGPPTPAIGVAPHLRREREGGDQLRKTPLGVKRS